MTGVDWTAALFAPLGHPLDHLHGTPWESHQITLLLTFQMQKHLWHLPGKLLGPSVGHIFRILLFLCYICLFVGEAVFMESICNGRIIFFRSKCRFSRPKHCFITDLGFADLFGG